MEETKKANFFKSHGELVALIFSLAAAAGWIVMHTSNLTNTFKSEIRQDMKKMEARMDKIDERWYELLKEIHSLDKKIHSQS